MQVVKFNRKSLVAGFAAAFLISPAAKAQLFIYPPDFSAPPVNGTEPGVSLPLPGATPEELSALLVWNLRAGLNVAALQCQFSPTLGTVRNYNQLLRHQSAELEHTRARLEAYFKRTEGSKGPRVFDQFTTKTYNSFSTLYAQLGFCQTAANIGRAALGTPKGQLHQLASLRLREFRNSLFPVGDRLFGISYAQLPVAQLTDPCRDSKGRRKKRC